MNKPFPMQDGPPIEWSEAEKIYQIYCCLFSDYQSLERIAKRGGFGYREIECLKKKHENWERCSCPKA